MSASLSNRLDCQSATLSNAENIYHRGKDLQYNNIEFDQMIKYVVICMY